MKDHSTAASHSNEYPSVVFYSGFTALSRIFHIYQADHSSKVGENWRNWGKTTWPSVSKTWLSHDPSEARTTTVRNPSVLYYWSIITKGWLIFSLKELIFRNSEKSAQARASWSEQYCIFYYKLVFKQSINQVCYFCFFAVLLATTVSLFSESIWVIFVFDNVMNIHKECCSTSRYVW